MLGWPCEPFGPPSTSTPGRLSSASPMVSGCWRSRSSWVITSMVAGTSLFGVGTLVPVTVRGSSRTGFGSGARAGAASCAWTGRLSMSRVVETEIDRSRPRRDIRRTPGTVQGFFLAGSGVRRLDRPRVHGGLAGNKRCRCASAPRLFGQNEFLVAGDAQLVLGAVELDHDLTVAAEDARQRHAPQGFTLRALLCARVALVVRRRPVPLRHRRAIPPE